MVTANAVALPQTPALPPPDEAALIERHRRLLTRSARRLANRTGHPELADELWSAGALGLIDAAQRFEPARGVRFETFAEHRIRGAMLDELRRMDHLPRRLRQQTEAVTQASKQLADALGRAADSSEVAARTGLEVAVVEELLMLTRPLLPLDDVSEMVLNAPDAHELVERRELADRLAVAVDALPERLQLVLSLHYTEGLTYREIAEMLGVSEPRVCQLHGAAVGKLRAALASEPG